MRVKLLEVRDRATFIQAVAIECLPSDAEEKFLLRSAGYGYAPICILFGRLGGGHFSYDAYSWNDRTMQTAHKYIEEHFDELESGAVVDVEFILGETKEPKASEHVGQFGY